MRFFLLVVVENVRIISTRALRLRCFQHNLEGGSKLGQLFWREIFRECCQVKIMVPRSLGFSFALGGFQTLLLFLLSSFLLFALRTLFITVAFIFSD